jgi:hypothetical protein
LISDLQEGAKLDGLQGHDWPAGVKVTLERVDAKHIECRAGNPERISRQPPATESRARARHQRPRFWPRKIQFELAARKMEMVSRANRWKFICRRGQRGVFPRLKFPQA